MSAQDLDKKIANDKINDLAAKYKADQEAIKNEGSGCALLLAAKYGDVEKVSELLKSGTSVESSINQNNIKYLYCDGDNTYSLLHLYSTALMVASNYGHLNVVQILISKGAKVDEVCAGGLTALMYASMKGHADIVRFLIESKADLHKVSRYTPVGVRRQHHFFRETTALHLALFFSNHEIVQILLNQLALELEPLKVALKKQINDARTFLAKFIFLKPVEEFLDKRVSEVNLLGQAKEIIALIEKLKQNFVGYYQESQKKFDEIIVNLNAYIKQIEEKRVMLDWSDNASSRKDYEKSTPLQYAAMQHGSCSDEMLYQSIENLRKKEKGQGVKPNDELKSVVEAIQAANKDDKELKKVLEDMLEINKSKRMNLKLLLSSGCALGLFRKTGIIYDKLFLEELHLRAELEFFKQTEKPFVTNNADLKQFKELRGLLTVCHQPKQKKVELGLNDEVFPKEWLGFHDLPVDTTLPERYQEVRTSRVGAATFPSRVTALILEYENNLINPDCQDDYGNLHHARLLTAYQGFTDDSLIGRLKAVPEAPKAIFDMMKGLTNRAKVKFGYELEAEDAEKSKDVQKNK